MLLFIIILAFLAISVFMVWFFLAHDHGEKEPIGALWIVAGLGLASIVPTLLLESLIPDQYGAVQASPGISVGLLLSMLSVGIIEEACKFIPAALFLYKKRYFNEYIDGIIYFAIAGLGFGLPENILYSLQFGTDTGLLRIIATPFFHSAITAFIGYFLIRAKLNKKPLWTVALALGGAALLHGIYNFGLFSGHLALVASSLAIGLLVTATLFILFSRAGKLDRQAGLAVVGNNSYCRSCGHPNPKHNLYCSNCGNRA